MYFPGINEMAELAAKERARTARENRDQFQRNADEAYRRAFSQPKAKEADVEDADWREIPPEQLTGPR